MQLSENKIKILPDFIANQIAAGEVVQRPESVVKELIENSLDASANSIALVIRDAGKQLIHIVDNGEGMNRSDLELSIKRHATSKIRTSEDLEKIMTFGFRGEALASITSVAILEIRTRTASDDHGWQLVSEPLKEATLQPFNTVRGTQIFVRNLFYNVPARRKFLKSNLTEFRHIADTFLKIALIHFDKRFTFYDGDNMIFDVKPETQNVRIINLLGDKSRENLIPVDYQNEILKISGYTGFNENSKVSRANQYIYLNKRPIVNKALSHAIISSYEHLIEKAQPFFIINIEIDPEQVDVNVHPQKNEVKFEDDRFLYSSLHKAINESLIRTGAIPQVKFDQQTAMNPFQTIGSNSSDKENFMIVNKTTGEIISQNPYSPSSNNKYNSYQPDFARKESGQNHNFDLRSMDALFGRSDEPKSDKVTIETNDSYTSNSSIDLSFHPEYWQLHNKYIILQTQTGMMIIDQHAAHERVLYEKALIMMNKEMKQSQSLLFPLRVRFSATQMSLINELKQDLDNLGFNFNIYDDTLEFIGIPLDVKAGKEDHSLTEMLEVFESYEKFRPSTRRDNLAATFACKNAIKTGDKLTFDEMKGLITLLFKCEMPYACPHGRPTILEFKLEDFDKQFKRT
ncbi:MAG: DNA mismatch repair endonuclease MutL [Candidatus Kapabacteria bacterium]|nr:DNA mismatch repair endonuclease MutL [Candidatus Kapabacteria bacterium]